MFNKMHLEKGTVKRQKIDATSNVDRLSALPEALLQHVLSFLPSREAVQTCVLARSWRFQWKTVPALRIPNGKSFNSAYALNKFVMYLLLLRDQSPLHECELSIYHTEDEGETLLYLDGWIQYAISCQVASLRVRVEDEYGWQASNMHLVSQHLTRLELYGLEFEGGHLVFSSCPALEDVKMNFCTFFSTNIFSPSVKHLSFSSCNFSGDLRTRISAPNIISLVLDASSGLTPLVQGMPSLVSAYVRLGVACNDSCHNGYEFGGCDDASCEGCTDVVVDNGCVLLDGLSDAVTLELIADKRVFILRKDCQQGPTFGMLKTLLLNEWCVTADFGALVYFLQHAPILEKLTLQLQPYETHQPMLQTDENLKPTISQLTVSKHLKVVEIKCHKEDEIVHKFVKILGTFGLLPQQIDIWPNFSSTEKFSFEQTTIWAMDA